MGRVGSSVWVDGQDRLYANYNRVIDEVAKEAKTGLQRAGMKIIAQAQRNMKTAGYNGSTLNTTGRLSQSGKVQDISNDPYGVEVGFFSETSSTGYAAYVEYGRRAGKMPPVDELREWVRKKRSGMSAATDAMKAAAVFTKKTYNQMLDSLAWAVAISIKRRGTRPHPFFGPAVKKCQADVTRALTQAIKKVTDKDR